MFALLVIMLMLMLMLWVFSLAYVTVYAYALVKTSRCGCQKAIDISLFHSSIKKKEVAQE